MPEGFSIRSLFQIRFIYIIQVVKFGKALESPKVFPQKGLELPAMCLKLKINSKVKLRLRFSHG